MRPVRILYFAGMTGLMLILGCGGTKTAKVHGKVVYSGKPVTGGQIAFFSADDTKINPSRGVINEDGTFTVEKVPVGRVKVSVDTRGLKEGGRGVPGMPDQGKQMMPPGGISDEMKQKMEGAGKSISPGTVKISGTYVAIPAKFTDPEKSGLSFDINSGDNDIPVELK
jgi:hypothetical protein